MKILHVGNIANNAYLAAKWDRSIGIESFVANPDMYHIMSFPFWETDFMSRSVSNHYVKRSEIELLNRNPDWFFFGTWREIISQYASSTHQITFAKKNFFFHLVDLLIYRFWFLFRNLLKKYSNDKILNLINFGLSSFLRTLNRPKLLNFFNTFDIVVFYGPYTEVISDINLPRTIAVEHGTLRNFIWQNNFYSRRSLKGYCKADFIFVTNSDCITAATQLTDNATKIVTSRHPVDSDFHDFRSARLLRLQQKLSDLTIFIPSRWSSPNEIDPGKGADLFFDLIKYYRDDRHIKFFLIEWGNAVEFYKSKFELLGELPGVTWLGIQSRPNLRQLMAASDLVLDQFVIPAFGGIAIDALGIGVPLVTKVDVESEKFFYGETSPVFGAGSLGEIIDVIELIQTEQINLQSYFESSTEFFDKHLHGNVSGIDRLRAYIKLLRFQ